MTMSSVYSAVYTRTLRLLVYQQTECHYVSSRTVQRVPLLFNSITSSDTNWGSEQYKKIHRDPVLVVRTVRSWPNGRMGKYRGGGGCGKVDRVPFKRSAVSQYRENLTNYVFHADKFWQAFLIELWSTHTIKTRYYMLDHITSQSESELLNQINNTERALVSLSSFGGI
jgi:hypothetical protein